jgi:hypothetical protein
METNKSPQPIPPPPGVIQAIRAGLETISNHLSVLLPPLVLDLLLWFGPRLSVKNALIRMFSNAMDLYSMNGMANEMQVKQMMTIQELLADFFLKYNLFSVLRTFPVGVSSLLQSKMPTVTPFGMTPAIEVGSLTNMAGMAFLLTLCGWALGGLYFNWVSGATGIRETASGSGRAVMQTLLFSTILAAATFMIGIPVMIILGIIGLIGAELLQIAMFVIALFSAWIIVPIFFAPHGMYLRGQNAFYSIYSSLRMARFTLPSSSMFVLAVFIISQGLNYLWSVPEDNSWMMLVGIAGHAFVTTALLAASFIYYRDMNAWLEIVFERLKPNTAAPQA